MQKRKHKRRRRNLRIILLILAFFFIVIAGSFLSLYLYSNRNAVQYDVPERMVSTAHKLYRKGRLTEAVEQLAYYCQYYAKEDASELFLELGDWYTEKGDAEKASYAYNRALAIEDLEVKRSSIIETKGIPFRFRMTPLIGFTRNVHLVTNGESLISTQRSVAGKISSSGNLVSVEDYRTSNWFWLSNNMHTLILTGEFNCAIWEFQNGFGRSTVIESSQIDLVGKSYVSVDIPADAVQCRVTYHQPGDEYPHDNVSVYCGDQLYGLGGSYYSMISLPDLQENQSILYGDGIWTLWQDNQLLSTLELPEISYKDTKLISILSDVCGEFSVSLEPEVEAGNSVPVKLSVRNNAYHARPEGISAANVQYGNAEGEILLSARDFSTSAQITTESGAAEAVVSCRLYTEKADKLVLQFCGYTDGGTAVLTAECAEISNTVYLNEIPTDFFIPITNIELVRSILFRAESDESRSVTIESAALVQYGNQYDVQELCLGAFQRINYERKEIPHNLLTEENSSQCLISKDGRYLYSISETHGTFNVYRLAADGSSKKVGCLEHLGGVRDMVFSQDEQAILISSRATGMWIIDITNPELPYILSHYSTLEYGCGLTVNGQYAFIASKIFGVEIIDISDLKNPRYINRVVSAQNTEQEYFDVYVEENYLYIGVYMNKRVDVYDISDLMAPQLCAEIETDGPAQGIVVQDGLLYVSTELSSRNSTKSVWDYGAGTGNGLEIYDVNNPHAPKLLSITKVDGRNNLQNYDVWDVELSGHYAILSDGYNGILVYDVTNPAAPVCVRRLEYVMDTSDVLFTKWDPNVKTYQWDTDETDRGVIYHTAVRNGKAYTVIRQCGVVQVELGVELKPVKPATVGSYVESVCDDTVSVRGYKITAYQTPYCIWAAAEKNGRIYAAAGDGGILIFDRDLNLLHQELTGTTVRDIRIYSDILFTAEGTYGVGSYRMKGDTLEKLDLLQFRYSNSCASEIGLTADGSYLIAQLTQNYHATVDCFNPEKMSVIEERVNKNGLMYFRTVSNGLVAGRYVGIAGGGGSCWYISNNGKLECVEQPSIPLRQISNGFAAVGNRVLLTMNGGYRYYSVDNAAESKLIRINGMEITGKPTVSGDRLVVTFTAAGMVYILNIHSLDKPVLEACFSINGCPDTACIVGNAIYLPCRYGGLQKVEKVS